MSETFEPLIDDDAAITAFTARAERAASVVHRSIRLPELAELIGQRAEAGTVAVSPTLNERYPDLVEALRSEVGVLVPNSPEEAASAAVGVVVGEAIVVETGSVLVSEFELPDRLVSMLSPVLFQVVPASAVLETFDDVGAELTRRAAGGKPGYQVLITGPSRSADIERSLTVGVQGPAELHVALIVE